MNCSITRRHRRQAVDVMNAACFRVPRDDRASARAIIIAALAWLSVLRADDIRRPLTARWLEGMHRIAREQD